MRQTGRAEEEGKPCGRWRLKDLKMAFKTVGYWDSRLAGKNGVPGGTRVIRTGCRGGERESKAEEQGRGGKQGREDRRLQKEDPTSNGGQMSRL